MSKTASGMFEEGDAYITNVYKYNVHTVQSSMKKTNDRPSESISISCGNGLYQEKFLLCSWIRTPKILFPNIWKQYLQLNDKYIPQYCQPERSEGWFVIIFVSQNNVMLVVLCTEIILFHMGFAFLHQVENAKKFDYFHDCCSDFSLNANCFKGQNKDSCQVETKTTSFLPSEPLNCKK